MTVRIFEKELEEGWLALTNKGLEMHRDAVQWISNSRHGPKCLRTQRDYKSLSVLPLNKESRVTKST